MGGRPTGLDVDGFGFEDKNELTVIAILDKSHSVCFVLNLVILLLHFAKFLCM